MEMESVCIAKVLKLEKQAQKIIQNAALNDWNMKKNALSVKVQVYVAIVKEMGNAGRVTGKARLKTGIFMKRQKKN